MSTEKAIDSPLATSYCIAILAADHSDRLFLSHDQYRNRLAWSRLYRPGIVYPSVEAAQEIVAEIMAHEHPLLTEPSANVDLSSLRILQCQIGYRIVG
jgi:hypothetical protein